MTILHATCTFREEGDALPLAPPTGSEPGARRDPFYVVPDPAAKRTVPAHRESGPDRAQGMARNPRLWQPGGPRSGSALNQRFRSASPAFPTRTLPCIPFPWAVSRRRQTIPNSLAAIARMSAARNPSIHRNSDRKAPISRWRSAFVSLRSASRSPFVARSARSAPAAASAASRIPSAMASAWRRLMPAASSSAGRGERVEGGGGHGAFSGSPRTLPCRSGGAAGVACNDDGGGDAHQAPRQPGFERGELGIPARFEAGEVGADFGDWQGWRGG